MKILELRRVSATVASACQALGRGRELAFTSAGAHVNLIVGPLLPTGSYPDEHRVNLSSKQGSLHLSNADALLSLLGETPVTTCGTPQPWYWQLINQQFCDVLYDLLSPLEPQPQPGPLPDQLECRVTVERNGEQAHGVLSCSAETLLRLFDAAPWHFIQRPWPGDWPLHYPLVLGQLELTANELRALRVGDVVLPAHTLFDTHGQGHVQLGQRRWTVRSECPNDHLQLRLIHEEHSHHEQ